MWGIEFTNKEGDQTGGSLVSPSFQRKQLDTLHVGILVCEQLTSVLVFADNLVVVADYPEGLWGPLGVVCEFLGSLVYYKQICSNKQVHIDIMKKLKLPS